MTAADPDLARLQRWMQAVLLHPGGAAAGLADARAREHVDVAPEDVGRVLRDLPDVAAADTLGIYARMIRRRFLGCVEADFPALRHHLGDGAFGELARGFVDAAPSRHWSLNRYALPFADTVRARLGDGFAADLADLERAICEVRIEADASTLELDELLAAVGAGAESLVLATVPALRLLAQEFPVEPWYRAWRRDEPRAAPAPAPSFVAVYRNRDGVWRLPLSREQHALLAELRGGTTLADALDAAAGRDGVDAEALAAGLADGFREWAGEGLFRGAG